jgi:hypothetical protein
MRFPHAACSRNGCVLLCEKRGLLITPPAHVSVHCELIGILSELNIYNPDCSYMEITFWKPKIAYSRSYPWESLESRIKCMNLYTQRSSIWGTRRHLRWYAKTPCINQNERHEPLKPWTSSDPRTHEDSFVNWDCWHARNKLSNLINRSEPN